MMRAGDDNDLIHSAFGQRCYLSLDQGDAEPVEQGLGFAHSGRFASREKYCLYAHMDRVNGGLTAGSHDVICGLWFDSPFDCLV